MNQALLQYFPVVLLWSAVAYKLPALRRNPKDPALRAYWLTLVSFAFALTVLLAPVYLVIDRLSGVPNIARLLANGLGLVTSLAVQAFLLYLSESEAVARRAVRRLSLALGGVLALMASLFIAAPVDQEAIDFTRRYGDAPFVLEYRLVFFAYLGLATANVARLSWSYAKVANRPSLRLGLRFVATGGLAGFMYVTHEGMYVVARRFEVAYPIPKPETVTLVLVATCAGLTVVGSTMPAWGPHLGIPQLCRWVSNYRSLCRLYPLWYDVCQASPEITLVPPSPRLAEIMTVRDLSFRLYRRTVEIRDGRLALRSYFSAEIADTVFRRCQAAGLGVGETQATIEAASLAVAIRAKAKGRSPAGAIPISAPPGGSDVTSEVAALEQVAYCYRNSAVVRETLARMEQDETAVTANVTRLPDRS